MAIKSIKVLKDDCIINVPMHSSFYTALRNSVLLLIDKQKDPKQALINAAESPTVTIDESMIKLSLSLLKSIEEEAQAQDMVVDKDIEIPDITEDPS